MHQRDAAFLCGGLHNFSFAKKRYGKVFRCLPANLFSGAAVQPADGDDGLRQTGSPTFCPLMFSLAMRFMGRISGMQMQTVSRSAAG